MYRIKIKSNFFTAQFWGLLSFSFRTRKKLFGSQHYQYHSIAILATEDTMRLSTNERKKLKPFHSIIDLNWKCSFIHAYRAAEIWKKEMTATQSDVCFSQIKWQISCSTFGWALFFYPTMNKIIEFCNNHRETSTLIYQLDRLCN